MSLIILKNNNQQPANAFSNNFTNTLTIPSNSEIALHSMSLNRLPRYAVNDYVFYVYHGPKLDSDSDVMDGGSETVQEAIRIKLINGAYTIDELTQHIEDMLKLHDIHPNFQQKWVVSKQMSSDGSTFEGIKLVCDQLAPVADAAAAVVPPAMISVNRNGPDVVYNTSNGKITRQTSDPLEQVYARTTYPMNLNRGEIIYDFEYAVDLTSIDHNNAFGIGRDYQPPKYGSSGDFMDIWVTIADGVNVGNKAGDVLVSQYIWSNSDWDEDEVFYYKDSTYGPDPDSAFKLLNEPLNLVNLPPGFTGKTYNAIKFKFLNEQISIFIGDKSTDTWDRLAGKHFLKPVAFSNCACYPKAYIPESGGYLSLTADLVTNYNSFDQHATIGDMPWVSVDRDLNQHIISSDNKITYVRDSSSYAFNSRGLSASTPGEQQHIPYNCVLISGYVDSILYYMVDDANMSKLLGFASIDEQVVVKAATTSKCSFVPTDISSPGNYSLKGDAITFVRCKSLTQRSLNGDTASISSIICDVPRYIASASYGRLFYAPPEKTYLKLNNEAPITLSRLEIEVVNSNEILVPDLTDETCVIVHIRNSNN